MQSASIPSHVLGRPDRVVFGTLDTRTFDRRAISRLDVRRLCGALSEQLRPPAQRRRSNLEQLLRVNNGVFDERKTSINPSLVCEQFGHVQLVPHKLGYQSSRLVKPYALRK